MMGLGLGRKGSMRQPENTKQHKITFVLFFYHAAFAWHSGGGDAPIPFSDCLYALLSAPFAAVGQRHIRPFHNGGDFGGVEFVKLSAFQAVGQPDGAKAHAHQAAYG